jgi:hypothetical protein
MSLGVGVSKKTLMFNYQVSILITKNLSVPKFISTDPESLTHNLDPRLMYTVQMIPFMQKNNRQKL